MRKIEFMPCDFCPDGCRHYEPVLHTDTTSYCGGKPVIDGIALTCRYEDVCAMHIKCHDDETPIDAACAGAALKRVVNQMPTHRQILGGGY